MYRVCFVCTGTICRSPMAESVFRAQVERAGHDEVPGPYYGSLEGFEECLELVEAAGPGLLDAVREAMKEHTA
ncbi:hypothetical protein AB0G42_28505 [Streptomyces yangpuensis]|uniref:arsenate reductase/protein-tyrosine-phosphatase family protein n=1 Tax=Streptomyces yangpuensis TaxID=1648182 RepID=UPI00342D7026